MFFFHTPLVETSYVVDEASVWFLNKIFTTTTTLLLLDRLLYGVC